MKRGILAGLLSLSAVAPALAQDAFWVNNIVVSSPPDFPPNIDATVFINNGIVSEGSGFAVNLLAFGSSAPFATADTLFYTNFGTFASTTGLRLDYFQRSTSTYFRANSIYNEVGATINCGGTNITGIFGAFGTTFAFNPFSTSSQFLGRATNFVNHGIIEMGIDGLFSMSTECSDLTGGLLNMEGFESGGFSTFVRSGGGGNNSSLNPGIFDSTWNVGQNNNWFPGLMSATTGASPNHTVTNRYYTSSTTSVNLGFATAYQSVVQTGPSNNLIQVVMIQNLADPFISNNVYFLGGTMEVEWTWPFTNIITGDVIQQHLFLDDDIANVTNVILIPNGTGPYSIGQRPTYIPTNYIFFRSTTPFGANPAPSGLTPGLLNFPNPGVKVTNEFTAYTALFQPTTTLPYETSGQSYTNMTGRLEVSADKNLDLTRSRIGALNFLKLNSPNNFTTDSRTRILTYAGDYNLGVTNGFLRFTNLIPPACPRPSGTVQLYSGRWTNFIGTNDLVLQGLPNFVFGALTTNIFTVLLVDSQISHSAAPVLQNLSLHSTNVFLSDTANVLSNLFVDAYNFTITTNGPDAATPAGQLNLQSGKILWTNSFPNLRTLTNFGQVTVDNTAFFGGVRVPPFYPLSTVEPYWDFVNHGNISCQGCFIWATNIENTGLIDGGPLSVSVQANTASFTNATVNAIAGTGDILLNANNLFVSNTALNAGRKLLISATNSLSDGGPDPLGLSPGNQWTAGVGGFVLPQKPATASLLGTTITETAPAFAGVVNVWAGDDLGKGPPPLGFNNNAALEKLSLSAGYGSVITFQPPSGTTNKALYVDYLELRDYATNHDNGFNLTYLQINPGIKIYYAQAVMVYSNGTVISQAERLNGKNGGGLVWVASYAGPLSGTNFVYPDGTTNRLNTALVTSTDIDSDGDGIVNAYDPTPIPLPKSVMLSIKRVTQPAPSTQISWPAIGFSTNFLYYKASPGSTNWLLKTNFVWDPVFGQNGTATVLDSAPTNRFYRVRVDLRQP
jgi:hypothetical protein